jgi:tetratricopeptide (TPR) repeat protein
MAAPAFAIDQARLAEARRLPEHCHDDFLRLTRTLIHGPPFQWLLVEAPDEGLRRQVMTALDRVLRCAGLASNRLPLSDRIHDVPMLEARLVKIARSAPVVHVIGRPGWFDAARWEAFNTRRERLAAQARARLVFWLDAEALALASRAAPDLWAWRAGVYAFLPLAASSSAIVESSESLVLFTPFQPVLQGTDPRSMAEKSRRVVEINRWLSDHLDAPDDLRVPALKELGELLFSLGDYDAALRHWQTAELPVYRRLGDGRSKAIKMARIADVMRVRGKPDEAMKILRDDVLPVFDRLGDVHSQAVTMGCIADILKSLGRIDESLRIRQEQELPVYERLGDGRAKAITMWKIAEVLQARGQSDEAVRILREDVLPVSESLGDVRMKALTMGKLADALQARGQLDQALRIRQEEELPVYQRLGDVRSQASTMGRIADVLQARGQLDEALRIRREEELPVFERLGDEQAKAATMRKIADLQQARRPLTEVLQADG